MPLWTSLSREAENILDTTDCTEEQILCTQEILAVASIPGILASHTAVSRPVQFDQRATLQNYYCLG